MREEKEKELRNALCDYIKNNFVLEGNPALLESKVRDLANGLFELFVFFNEVRK